MAEIDKLAFIKILGDLRAERHQKAIEATQMLNLSIQSRKLNMLEETDRMQKEASRMEMASSKLQNLNQINEYNKSVVGKNIINNIGISGYYNPDNPEWVSEYKEFLTKKPKKGGKGGLGLTDQNAALLIGAGVDAFQGDFNSIINVVNNIDRNYRNDMIGEAISPQYKNMLAGFTNLGAFIPTEQDGRVFIDKSEEWSQIMEAVDIYNKNKSSIMADQIEISNNQYDINTKLETINYEELPTLQRIETSLNKLSEEQIKIFQEVYGDIGYGEEETGGEGDKGDYNLSWLQRTFGSGDHKTLAKYEQSLDEISLSSTLDKKSRSTIEDNQMKISLLENQQNLFNFDNTEEISNLKNEIDLSQENREKARIAYSIAQLEKDHSRAAIQLQKLRAPDYKTYPEYGYSQENIEKMLEYLDSLQVSDYSLRNITRRELEKSGKFIGIGW